MASVNGGLRAMRRLLGARTPDEARAGAAPDLLPLLTDEAFALVKRTAGEADHGGQASPEAWASVFDRLATRSPAASVALYSLGDEVRLGAATDEVVAWLGAQGLLGRDRLAVEIGCGIGRFLRALSPMLEAVVGLDVSTVMCAEARIRTAGLDNVVVIQTPGRDLSVVGDDSADLVLAVDSFPYLASAGLAEAHVREAARVLSPGGDLIVFNWSYRDDLQGDQREAGALAAEAGLELLAGGDRPLTLWDGALFHLRRPAR